MEKEMQVARRAIRLREASAGMLLALALIGWRYCFKVDEWYWQVAIALGVGYSVRYAVKLIISAATWAAALMMASEIQRKR